MTLVVLLAAACASPSSPQPGRSKAPTPAPAAASPTTSPRDTSEPTGTPIAAIEHATGRTDVVLRYDVGFVDFGICELCGGWGAFEPGPEFTLYGDGTVIVRNALGELPPADGPIVRAQPFRIAHLGEDQVQSLLRFAIGEGGLGDANEQYESTSTDTDDASSAAAFMIRAGGLDKRVDMFGPVHPFSSLRDHLLFFAERSGSPTQVWVPGSYWGLLIEVSSWIEVGVVQDPPDSAIAAWPWEGISPWVVGTATDAVDESRRRVMSTDEAAVLSLSDNGGVVQQIYLFGPDGGTIYSFSLWAMLPDETG